MQIKNSRIHSIDHKSYNIQLFPKKNGISSILKQRKKLDKDREKQKWRKTHNVFRGGSFLISIETPHFYRIR